MADYNLKIIDNKVIFDGHAENPSDCHTLTLLCNLLQKNTKTVDYRTGYAEFELEDIPSENRFWFNDAQTFYINDILVQVQAISDGSSGRLSIDLSFSQDGVTVHNVGSLQAQAKLGSELDLNSYFSVTSISSISAGETALLPFLDNIKLRSILSSDGQEISEGDIISEDGTKLTVSKIRSIDLTTLPGWSSLSDGSHNITVVAKADGYRDSEPSAAVSVTKGTQEYTDCITFTGETSDFTLAIGSKGAKEWDGTVWYSTDHNTWTVWGGSAISSVDKKLYLRGKNNSTFYTSKGAHLSLSAKAACSGNLNTLLEYSNPPTTLANRCYAYMFYGCTNLTTAPALPATTLASYCYNYMFQGCTSLTQAPELPATTLEKSCYAAMFNGCTNLTTATTLPATTLAISCYSYMFQDCTSLTQAPELPATTLEKSCYSYMFFGCTNLTTAPALPATTLAISCYAGMFYGCTSLTVAPELPATTLANRCYASMFNGCTSLKISATQSAEYPTAWRIPSFGVIPSTATDWNENMLNNTGGTFTSDPSINTTYYGAWTK